MIFQNVKNLQILTENSQKFVKNKYFFKRLTLQTPKFTFNFNIVFFIISLFLTFFALFSPFPTTLLLLFQNNILSDASRINIIVTTRANWHASSVLLRELVPFLNNSTVYSGSPYIRYVFVKNARTVG